MYKNNPLEVDAFRMYVNLLSIDKSRVNKFTLESVFSYIRKMQMKPFLSAYCSPQTRRFLILKTFIFTEHLLKMK